jgi:hypothetical protein
MADNVEMTLRPIEVTPDNKPTIDFSKLDDAQLSIAEKIVSEAQAQGVDPEYALSIAHIENKFNHNTSPAGALGVMQLMPNTAKELGVDPLDVDQNIKGGITYLKQQLDHYKDPYVAGMAYNAGPGVADKFLETQDPSVVPTETLNYIDNLSNLYKPKGQDETADMPDLVTMPPTPPTEEDNSLRNKAIAGATTGTIAGLANANTRQKMIEAEAEQSTPRQRAAAKLRSENADIALKEKSKAATGRLTNQQSLVLDAEKKMASWDNAFSKAQDRLTAAEELARKLGIVEENVQTSPGGVTQKGGLGSGAMKHSNVMGEVHEANVVRKGTEATGSGWQQKSRLIVPEKYAATSSLSTEQLLAQKNLEKAQRDYRQAQIDLSKAKSAHANESKKLASLSKQTESGISKAEENLEIAKKQYENVASKRMPGMFTRVGQQVGKSVFGSVIPGAAAGVDLEDARQRYNRGDIPGAVISGIGGVGGAMSMIPPIPPIGTAARLIGGLTSLVAPAINYYRDSTATEDEQATANAPKYAAGGAVKKFERGGANDVDTVKAPPSDLGDEVLRWSADKIDLARKYLNEAPIPNPFKLLSGDVSMMDSVGDMYFGDTAGLLDRWSKGKAPITFPAYGPKLVNAKFDPAIIDAIGAAFPIVSAAKAGLPLVKAGGKKLFNELAEQYETGTGLGKYLVEPRMNVVEKDKGKIIRANDRGEEVTRASRTNKKTGQYVGAPPGVDSPQALGALVNDYVKGMDQGLPGRNFYTDSSKDIWDRTGHNMTEADLLAQNIAILSRANNVGGNTSMSAKAHIQAATGDPIRTGRFPSKDSPPLQAMYDAGQAEYLGHKRDPFATQLGVTYAPERIGRGVNDMHEAELMGYPTGKVAGATQHSFMDEVRARAIDKANQTNLGGFNDWGTGNAQAAAWSGNKIRRGDISAGDAAKSYADYFPLHEANATYEAVSSPVTGHLQGLLDAPFEERLKYTFDPRGSWDTSASGRDIGYTASGLLPGESSFTVGRFKDSANPAFVARPVIGTETTATGERVMTPGSEGALNAVEASRAYFDAQEAAAWHKIMPAKNADAYTGVTIDFGRDFTKADMEKVAPLFESKGYYLASAPDGVTIMTNSNTPVGKEFSNDIRQVLKNNKDIFSKTKTDFGVLKSNYIDYGDAWSSGVPGSVTKELLKYIDTAPVTGSKLEGSQLYRDTVKARNARDLAAEKSGLGKVRADMVRAREIFAKEGWNGLRKAAEAGIVPAVFLSPNAVPEDWR